VHSLSTRSAITQEREGEVRGEEGKEGEKAGEGEGERERDSDMFIS